MMQQINLYTDAFRPKKVVLPLSQIITLPILVAALLIGVSVWLEASLLEFEQEVAKLEEANDSLKEKLVILDKRVSKMRKDDSLVAANERLNHKLQARKNMVEMLDTVVVKDDEGFSGILISLARQNIEPLWIEHILIGGSGRQLRLEGMTSDSEAVPIYLQKLRQENSFVGRTFMGFELTRDKSEDGLMKFALYTADALESEKVELQELASSSDIVSFAIDKAGAP